MANGDPARDPTWTLESLSASVVDENTVEQGWLEHLVAALRSRPSSSGALLRWASRALLAGVALGTGSPAASAQTDAEARIRVQVRSGLVTVDVSNASLVDVIRAIGEEAGFTTVVRGSLDVRVTRSLAEVPVEDAVRRLAREVALVMIHTPGPTEQRARPIEEVHLYASEPAEPAPSRVTRAAKFVDPELLAGLSKDDSRERIRAVQKLGRSGEMSAVAVIAPVVSEDDHPSVRGQAAAALGRIGSEQAIPALQAALGDSNRGVRVQAIRALGRVGGERAARILGDALLNETDQGLRRTVAWSLGGLESELARSYLEAAAGDSDDGVRKTIDQSLARWKKARKEDL